jgi:hypothetical protein
MHWKSFQEKASKINGRWFFMRGTTGFEVWERALLYGPGFPRKYKLMIIPFNVSLPMWHEKLKRLKWMHWIRRKNEQSVIVEDMIKKYDIAKQQSGSAFLNQSKSFFKDAKKKFREAAEDANISETSIRLRLKDVAWDDTKKFLRKVREQRGAY